MMCGEKEEIFTELIQMDSFEMNTVFAEFLGRMMQSDIGNEVYAEVKEILEKRRNKK